MEKNFNRVRPQPRYASVEDTSDGFSGPWWQHPFTIFLLPFFVYMVIGSFEPKPSETGLLGLNYPSFYAIRITLTFASILLAVRGYRKFPFTVNPISIGVGVVGVVLWVGICQLELERLLLVPIGLGWLVGTGERAAYDPFSALAGGQLAFFLTVRFIGLAAIVPLIEEMLLRGFVMRVVSQRDWWTVSMNDLGRASVIAATVYGIAAHPAEMFAAAVWFSLVTWMLLKTRNIWDCVIAHAVTNLLLGIYIVTTGNWHLW